MTWNEILALHTAKYPNMEPRDYGKLAYQSCFGPEHMISGAEQVEAGILREWREMERCSPEEPEPIGGGLCRFPLSLLRDERDGALLARLFAATARTSPKQREAFPQHLAELRELDVPGMEEWLAEYEQAGCPPVGHSEAFRQAYHPHYRLVKEEYARVFPIFRDVVGHLEKENPVILAIDGRCGSGKSSLGRVMAEVFFCVLVHMDDYYRPAENRAANWMEIPGGNMDLERFRAEVLEPFKRGEAIHSRPYCCQSGTMGEERVMPRAPLLVVEGSYSHHPLLRDRCDRTIFLTCGREEQIRRLQVREGAYFHRFRELWMPLEERYFQAYSIPERADVVVDTGKEGMAAVKRHDFNDFPE